MRQCLGKYLTPLLFVFYSIAFAQEVNSNPFQLVDATIDSVHTAMQQRTLTCVQLVDSYLNRIKRFNLDLTRGAPINALVAINPSLYEEAARLDQSYQQTGKWLGPLHCIPVLLKDNIDTADITTSAGSLALLGSQPVKDAFIVEQLRKSGAIILGKSAMDELSGDMIGISSRSGRIGNAFDPQQNPGGSSGGSGAAISANFAMLAVGTDNSGSIRIPAVFNGIYGLRPTTGLISQTGIFPRGNLDGVAGPMARTVKDLAIMLDVLAKSDPRDRKTATVTRTNSYTDFLKPEGLKGKRIGVIRSGAGIEPFKTSNKAAEEIFNATLKKLETLGVTLIDVHLSEFDTQRDNNMAGEVEDINNYLRSFPSTRKDYRDICKSDRTRAFQGGLKGCLSHLKNTAKRGGARYESVLAMFVANRKYVESNMEKHQLDALIMPISTVGSATYDPMAVNTWQLPIASNAGMPAITIIGGYTPTPIKMPVGLELIGKSYGEGLLIEMAYAFEQNSGPRLVPTLPEAALPSPLMAMSIPSLNNLWTVIGNAAYDKVLKNGKKEDLTAQKFGEIVRGVVG